MHPSQHATRHPHRPAIIMADSGQQLSYAQLESSANRGAHLFRALGLRTGDSIALLFENSAHLFELCWAAQRAGLYYTPLSTRLTLEEAAYIVNDCDARVLVASSGAGELARALSTARPEICPKLEYCYYVGDPLSGALDWNAALARMPEHRIADEAAGQHMIYSSGTTGRPKGVKLPLSGEPADAEHPFVSMNQRLYAFHEGMVFLCPAPLYHTAPLVMSMVVHRIGGTTVILEHFTPEGALRAIERYRVTHTQMVPTMFVRLIKLPESERTRHDLSSLRVVQHSAAPCPIAIKRQMIEWLGPILYEYYGGTEANGATYITSQQWLDKPGSVGRANWGTLHICDADGHELPAGQQGLVYFEGGLDFRYHNDPQKTADSRHPQQRTWSTLGDIGYVDQDGFLFLTDRQAFTIISGGVNIYPQETENVLITHPKVADVAVIGVPNDEFGEEVKAVVQPLNWEHATPALAEELITYCRRQLSPLKCPRSIDFERELPRHLTGKLYKRLLRERYWAGKESRLV